MAGLGKLLNSTNDAGSSSDELCCMNSRAKSARNLSSVSPSISSSVPGPAAGPGMAAADTVATPTAASITSEFLSYCLLIAFARLCVGSRAAVTIRLVHTLPVRKAICSLITTRVWDSCSVSCIQHIYGRRQWHASWLAAADRVVVAPLCISTVLAFICGRSTVSSSCAAQAA